MIKVGYDKPTANILLDGEKLKAENGNKTRVSTLTSHST